MTMPHLRGERGFTLIELMVAALSGIIVAGAMGAIVVASVHLRSNLGDRVDANQLARTAMEKITQALNSSCVATAVAPILGGTNSDDTHLVFYSSLTDVPTIQPNLVTVSLTGNQLNMSTATWASGTAPTPSNPNPWTFNTGTAITVPLLQHAAAATIGGVAQPVFQYYGYTAGGTISAIPFTATSTTPLSTTDASNTAMVKISFQALPSSNNAVGNRGANLTDSVVLRLTPASAGGAASNLPCT